MKPLITIICILVFLLQACQKQTNGPNGKNNVGQNKEKSEKETLALHKVPYAFKSLIKRIIVHGGNEETNFSLMTFNDPSADDGGQLTASGVVKVEALNLSFDGTKIPIASPCIIDADMLIKTQTCGNLHLVLRSNKYEVQSTDKTIECINTIIITNKGK